MPYTLLVLIVAFGVLSASLATCAERGEQSFRSTPPAPQPSLSVSSPMREPHEGNWIEAGRSTRSYEIMNACAGSNRPKYWIQKLKAADPHTRVTAARALGELREGTVVPALIEALNDKDGEVRLAVVKALGRIGPPAKGAVPVLSRMREDADAKVRGEVVRALKQIDKYGGQRTIRP